MGKPKALAIISSSDEVVSHLLEPFYKLLIPPDPSIEHAKELQEALANELRARIQKALTANKKALKKEEEIGRMLVAQYLDYFEKNRHATAEERSVFRATLVTWQTLTGRVESLKHMLYVIEEVFFV